MERDGQMARSTSPAIRELARHALPGEAVEGEFVGRTGALILTNERLYLVKLVRLLGVTLRSSVVFWPRAEVRGLRMALGRRTGTVTIDAPGDHRTGPFQPAAQAANALVIDARDSQVIAAIERRLRAAPGHAAE